ncbi:MAG: hypothetical protein PCFJNLEI_02252 [Verrucomicrobiae bacterium]|nr:hypothetical protein [Verrucomicrobiae bacterium]
MKNQQTDNPWISQWLLVALFALAGLALLAFFVLFAEPPHRTLRTPYQRDYSEEPLIERLTPTALQARVAQLAALSVRPGERQIGRASGSPGFYRTEELITREFAASGLTIQKQEFEVVVPVTEYCEIVGADGQPLPGVELYPFEPSGLTPIALPAAGIKAQLVEAERIDLTLLAGHDPRETILLTYVDAAVGWLTAAGAGVQALIVREDEITKSLRANPDVPAAWAAAVNGAETLFPRFVARGPIEKFAGQTVTIRAKVTWQLKPVRNIIGVLPGKGTSREALVVTTYYDSSSLVPELAPGAEQALSLAALLEYVQALAPYRGQLQRDLVFVVTAGHAQAMAGAAQLLAAIETFSAKRTDYRSLADRRALHAKELTAARQALAWCDAGGTGPISADESFAEGLKIAAGEINLDIRNEVITAQLAYFRAGRPIYRDGFAAAKATDAERAAPENTHPLLRQYIELQTRDNAAANLMGLTAAELVRRPEFLEWGYLPKARGIFAARVVDHEAKLRQLDDSLAVQQLFARYERTLTVNLDLYSGGQQARRNLAVAVGVGMPGTVVEPQVSDLTHVLLNHARDIQVVHWGSRDISTRENRGTLGGMTTIESAVWFRCGRLAFTVTNHDFYPSRIGTPEDVWPNLALGVMEQQVPLIGKTVLELASGQVPFKTIPPGRSGLNTVRGTVYGNAGTSSVVPSHRMAPRTFARAFARGHLPLSRQDTRGVQLYPILAANPDGEFGREFLFDLSAWGSPLSVAAVRFNAAGQVEYFNDTSPASQSLFKSQAVPGADVNSLGRTEAKSVNLSLFRCTPVALYDQINPQTTKAFKGVAYLDRLGLSGPPRFHYSGFTAFLPPDFLFYIGLQDGAADNPELLTDRAYMLNVNSEQPAAPGEPDVFGRGYLAADAPVLALPAFDAAASMLRTSEKRLQLQKKFGMADEQMLGFHQQGVEWLADAREKLAAKDPAGAVNSAGTSLAYAINNNPVIRSRISQAVVGILWYLGLLVPFVFFTEKLVCGFTDIRKQLVAIGVIFLIVFMLLRLFHPAFEMVRSSLMILLGFVILLLTFVVTLMVGGKFKQNLKELRSKEGRVEGADISRGGVVGTAFMLGLNNMRRRKVRTGLTCATLVLITFVMICFTSVSNDLVNVEQPTGRSGWNGLMVRDLNFRSLDAAQVTNLRQMYGTRYPITIHQWLVAGVGINGLFENSEILIDREYVVAESKLVKRSRVHAAMALGWNEPMFTGLDRWLTTKKGWFPRPPDSRTERLQALESGYRQKNLIILPDTVAQELGIRVEDVNEGELTVNIRGTEYVVQGIIDSAELAKCQGLDGQSILPYDLNTVQGLGTSTSGSALIPPDIGRLPATQVILVNSLPPAKPGSDGPVTAACLVGFPKTAYQLRAHDPEYPPLDYRTQRRLVLGYLERIGQPAYYAIDGIAYYGSRQRATTFAGLLELLVPIFIAALTVFNTMRGSVYERKSEIYVYNAVGIAPSHVFFMFMAEACVYAVLGAVLGYILSQGTGRLLTALDMTGGMNMDYSSMETIYASLAIMGSVLLSTIIPARDAAKLAAPSEIVSWTVPKAEGDTMTFSLPFTFTAHDRVAVVSYFQRWLDANGAGSSGPFFCSPPEAQVRLQPSAVDGHEEMVLAVASTVWLKPYDLGVSQRMEISLPTDPETGEYAARITLTRLSGHLAGWNRTLRPFLGVLRKQFLNWRATTDAERQEMFTEAQQLLKNAMAKETPHA